VSADRASYVDVAQDQERTAAAGARQMALARQAQRCAVGKLDCYCGCRYCSGHDDPDGVQVKARARAQIHFRNLAIQVRYLENYCVLEIPRPPSQSTFDVVVCLVMLKAPNCDGRHFFVV